MNPVSSPPPTRPQFSDRVREWMSHDTHPVIQFIKYGFSGLLALGTDFLVYSLCAWKLFPVTEEKELNYIICKSIAFCFSVMVAYYTNIRWVFKPGRHSRNKEVFYFFVVAILGFLPGTLLGQWMVSRFNLVEIWSLIPWAASVVFAVLFNYTGRKFFIFHK